MDTKRGKYTEEFKSAAVDRLYEPDAVLSKVAKELGLTSTQLKIWRLEREAAGSQEAMRRQQADAAELTRLRKENKRLEQENEILQKAPAFSQQGWGNHEEQTSVHCHPDQRLHGFSSVSAVGRLPQLVLRVPVFTTGASGPGSA